MLTLLNAGGPILWVIVFCGIVAAAVFLERVFHLHRARIKTDDFLRGIFNILARGNLAEALSICKETPGPVAALTHAAILRHGAPIQELRETIDRAALNEISRMENHAATLAVITHAAPLLGLLGAVMGLIRMLIVIQHKAPLVQISDLAGGAWQAALVAAGGLAAAIIAMTAYSIVMAKINKLAVEMERAAQEIIAFAAAREGSAGQRQ